MPTGEQIYIVAIVKFMFSYIFVCTLNLMMVFSNFFDSIHLYLAHAAVCVHCFIYFNMHLYRVHMYLLHRIASNHHMQTRTHKIYMLQCLKRPSADKVLAYS